MKTTFYIEKETHSPPKKLLVCNWENAPLSGKMTCYWAHMRNYPYHFPRRNEGYVWLERYYERLSERTVAFFILTGVYKKEGGSQ